MNWNPETRKTKSYNNELPVLLFCLIFHIGMWGTFALLVLQIALGLMFGPEWVRQHFDWFWADRLPWWSK